METVKWTLDEVRWWLSVRDAEAFLDDAKTRDMAEIFRDGIKGRKDQTAGEMLAEINETYSKGFPVVTLNVELEEIRTFLLQEVAKPENIFHSFVVIMSESELEKVRDDCLKEVYTDMEDFNVRNMSYADLMESTIAYNVVGPIVEVVGIEDATGYHYNWWTRIHKN